GRIGHPHVVPGEGGHQRVGVVEALRGRRVREHHRGGVHQREVALGGGRRGFGGRGRTGGRGRRLRGGRRVGHLHLVVAVVAGEHHHPDDDRHHRGGRREADQPALAVE